jgi:hypothetical protein
MESESQPTETIEASDLPEPITVRDVLRAVFLPVPLPERERPVRIQLPEIEPLEAPEPEVLDFSPATITYASPLTAADREALPIGRVVTLVVGTVISLALAYLGQTLFAMLYLGANVPITDQQRSTRGLIVYGLALAIWLIVLLFEIAPPDGRLLKRGPRTHGMSMFRPLVELADSALTIRLVLGTLALALSALTYLWTANNTFNAQGVTTWILSVILWMLALAERDPMQLLSSWREKLTTRPAIKINAKVILLTLAIMGVAAFFRFYRLDAIPVDMTSDHVEKLLDANDIASNGVYSVFFPRNGGREAIQMYLVALASRVFGTGISFLTLKLVAALEALVMIPLMVLLGREVIDEETGLFAAALLAISWWHTALGRLALRIALTPLILTPVLITLIRGMRTGRRKPWLWAGFWLGVGMYAYQAMRLAPLIAMAAFVFAVAGALWASATGRGRATVSALASRQMLNLLLAGIVALAIFVPMLRVWHDQPAAMWNRVINRTTSTEVAIQGEPLAILASNYWNAVRMFNWRGDVAWISALPGAPTLDVVTGALFLLGIVAWVVRIQLRRDPADGFLIVAGMIMLLPSALAIAFPIENPSVTRASGVIPVVFLIAAWPLALIRQRWTTAMGSRTAGALLAVTLGIVFVTATWINYDWYFVRYAQSYDQSSLNPGEVAEAILEELGPEGSLDNVWLQGYPFWHDYRAIGIEAGDITWHNAIVDVETLTTYLENNPEAFLGRPLIFIVHPDDAEGLAVLQEHFPEGTAIAYTTQTVRRGFILFVVPADSES